MKKISAFTAACVLISNVIGSGLFTTTGFMARDLGDPGLILTLWAAGALLALLGALSYGELGAAMPEAGGEYVYISRAYGRFLGFLSGWTSFTVGFGAAIAAAAMSFAAYVLQLLPTNGGTNVLATFLALGLVWILTAVHVAGIGPGGFVQRLLTVLKVGAIFLLILGAFIVATGNWEHFQAAPLGAPATWGVTFVSFIFVTYAYSGWNAAAYIAGEIDRPERNLPRSMLWGTLFVGALSLLVNVVYFYALPVTTLAQEPILPVAEKAAVALFGPPAARLVTVMLCISIAGAASAMIWVGPRVYYAMARDGLFPTFFSETRNDGEVPAKAIVVQSLWVSVLIVSGTFEQLVIYSGFALAVFSALAVGSVIVLRWRNPALSRPYQVPLYPLPPLLYLAVSLLIIVYTASERPSESLLSTITVLSGAPFFFLRKRICAPA
ncbi:MAG: APC family permease [Candidatus Binatia bacterium]